MRRARDAFRRMCLRIAGRCHGVDIAVEHQCLRSGSGFDSLAICNLMRGLARRRGNLCRLF